MSILKANLKFAFKIILMVQASVDNILIKEDREYLTQLSIVQFSKGNPIIAVFTH